MSSSTLDTNTKSESHLQRTVIHSPDSLVYHNFSAGGIAKSANKEIPDSTGQEECETSNWLAPAQVSTSDSNLEASSTRGTESSTETDRLEQYQRIGSLSDATAQ